MLKRFGIVAFLLLLALPMLTIAQDATPQISPIAGEYDIQNIGDSVGTMTIEGTGPVYSYTWAFGGGPSYGNPMLAMGTVTVAASPKNDCLPAILIRQSDGTLFGDWIDSSVSTTSLGLVHYTPQASTTDFVGKYDLVGSYADGSQYKGTAEITKTDWDFTYQIVNSYSADEHASGNHSKSDWGVAVASGNVLGYTYSLDKDATCKTMVSSFDDKGFQARYYDSTQQGGLLTGIRN
jgi:hypothetical protein